MKKISLLIFLLAIVFTIFAQTDDMSLDGSLKISKEQETIIKDIQLNFPENTQFSIAIIKNGNVTYYGGKNLNDTIVLNNNQDSVFEIGSVSKVFTATLLADAVINKEVKLKDKVSKKIKYKFNDKIDFTFQQLSNHTSGLPRLPSDLFTEGVIDPFNPYKDYSEERLEIYLKEKLVLSNEVGEKYDYSNLGTGLLAYSLSKIEGKDFETLLSEKIFSKYEMINSTTILSKVEDKLIPGLNNGGMPTSNWDLASLGGAGAIKSTVSDLANFAIAQFDPKNEILALTREKTFTINKNMDIALGWHIIHAKSGNTYYWHNGATGGYVSSMAIDVENETAVIILTNVSAFNSEMKKVDELCFGLMKELK